MTPEEAWKMHERWLVSIDNGLDPIAASPAEFRESVEQHLRFRRSVKSQ